MHSRRGVYRRSLRNNRQNLFRSNESIMQRLACCMSGFLGLLFLGLAILCFLSPDTDKHGKLFFIFMALFAIFEAICIVYSCILWLCRKPTALDSEESEDSSSSLVSSDEIRQDVPDRQGIASYQACAISSEVPTYQGAPSFQEAPSYQGAVPNLPVAPFCGDGGYLPGIVCSRSLVNYEGVLGYQQIPIYQQDMMEPQPLTYSSGSIRYYPSPEKNIYVY